MKKGTVKDIRKYNLKSLSHDCLIIMCPFKTASLSNLINKTTSLSNLINNILETTKFYIS